MTDVRLPERWITDRRVLLTTPPVWRLYTFALMYSVANRSDGVILPDDLQMMPTISADCAAELVKLGLWERRRDGWRITDFTATQAAGMNSTSSSGSAPPSATRNAASDLTRPRDGPPGTAQAGRQAGKAGTNEQQPQTCLGCDLPARAGCSTCWDHAYMENGADISADLNAGRPW